MGSEAINAHVKMGRTFSEWVRYETNAALSEGEAVCYNYDYGTDTDADGRRLNKVETPSIDNAQWFAGVAARAYAARAGGRMIEIYKPGSVCNILCGLATDTVVGVGLLTFDVTTSFKGEFRYEGLPGAGSAQPLQTTTGDDAAAGLCLALLQEGPPSGGVQVLTATAGARTDQMVGGTTLYIGGSIGTNQTLTLADGTIAGLRKKFKVITTELTTADIVITVTTGFDPPNSALQTVTWNNAQTCLDMGIVLVWLESWAAVGMGDGEPDIA